MVMRKIVIFVGLLAVVLSAQAQTDSFYVWNKWAATKDTLLLFNGANNVVQVYNKAMKPNTYKLKSLDKSLRIGTPEIKGDTLSVMAMPYPGKAKTMRLAILNSKTSKVMKTLTFVSDNVPEPIAQLGNIKSGAAAKKAILEQTVLKVLFPGSLYNYPYHIRSYTFKLQTAKGAITALVNGIWITPAIIKEIGDAPVGTELNFTNIQVTCPECVVKTLQDLKIKIR
jgi:hypothetical protein